MPVEINKYITCQEEGKARDAGLGGGCYSKLSLAKPSQSEKLEAACKTGAQQLIYTHKMPALAMSDSSEKEDLIREKELEGIKEPFSQFSVQRKHVLHS